MLLPLEIMKASPREYAVDDQVTDIEMLYFEGCPSYRQAWNDILEVIVETKVPARIRPVLVKDADAAHRLKFAGSPSIRIAGADLEGLEGEGTMACRVYAENGGKGWPSKKLIARELKRAAEA